MGNLLDQKVSLTKESLKTFYRSSAYKMNDYIFSRSDWKTFNDFFARSIKSGYRPIANLCDPAVIVSPTNSTINNKWEVSESSQINIKEID